MDPVTSSILSSGVCWREVLVNDVGLDVFQAFDGGELAPIVRSDKFYFVRGLLFMCRNLLLDTMQGFRFLLKGCEVYLSGVVVITGKKVPGASN